MAEQVVRKIPDLKALLIEKPVTPSSKEAEALRSILSSRNLAVIIGHIEVRGVQNFYPRMDEREWG